MFVLKFPSLNRAYLQPKFSIQNIPRMLHGSTGDRLYMSLGADYIESTSVMAHQLYSKNVQTCGPILTLPSPVFGPNAISYFFDAYTNLPKQLRNGFLTSPPGSKKNEVRQ